MALLPSDNIMVYVLESRCDAKCVSMGLNFQLTLQAQSVVDCRGCWLVYHMSRVLLDG